MGSPPGPNAWWDQWPRATNDSHVAGATATNSNVIIGASLLDPGDGPYVREVNFQGENQSEMQAARTAGVHRLAWIFGQGMVRSILGAQHADGGIYAMDPKTNAPVLVADDWNWNGCGLGCGLGCGGATCNPVATEMNWMGYEAFFNAERWQGPFVWPTFAPSIPPPTWAPSSGKTGNVPGGYATPGDPTSAYLYSAMGAKDLNGRLSYQGWTNDPVTNATGKRPCVDPNDGHTTVCGEFLPAKDIAGTASDFWLAVNGETIDYFVSRHFTDGTYQVDGFWQDNSSGWGDMGAWPVQDAFGDWSVSTFCSYANQPPTFDVRAYLVQTFRAQFPGVDPTNLDDVHWKDAYWLTDPVWGQYKAFKAGEAHHHAVALKQRMMTAALSRNRDPDSIVMMGNDPPVIWGGAYTGDELDMASYEYSTGWALDTGSQLGHGIPPDGHAGGSYALATRVGRSRHAIVWYYLSQKMGTAEIATGVPPYSNYRGHPVLGEVVGYEALANNVLLNGGKDNASIAGNDSSIAAVHATQQRLAPIFGHRVRTGNVAIVYSTETNQAMLAPGGFVGFDNGGYMLHTASYLDHNLGYYGWASALETLHYPYRAIPDFRLATDDLSGVFVLILPHVRAIEQSTITNVLLPFLARGGQIILTGADSGSVHTQQGNYAPQTAPLLVSQLVGRPGVYYTTDNPGFNYHITRLTPAAHASALNVIASFMGSAVPAPFRELVIAANGDARIEAVVHADPAAGKWFIDLANLDITLTTDQLTSKNNILVTYTPPPGVPPANLLMHPMYYPEGGSVLALPARVVGSSLQFTVPVLNYYGTIVLSH